MPSSDYRSLCGPKRLGDRLLEAGLITRTELDRALDRQETGSDRRLRLGRTLVELGFLTDRDLIQMLSAHVAMPVASCSIATAEEHALCSIPAGLARRHRAVPYRVSSGSLLVAVPDPLGPEALEDLETVARLPVLLHLAPEADIEAALARHYGEPLEDAIAGAEGAAVSAAETTPSDSPTLAARLRELARNLQELADGHERLSLVLAAAEEEAQKLAAEHVRVCAELEHVRGDNNALRGSLLDVARHLLARDGAATYPPPPSALPASAESAR